MNDVLIAIISGVVAIAVAIIQVWRKKDSAQKQEKAVTQNQEILDTTLNTVTIQSEQIRVLRSIVEEQKLQLEDKDRKIQDLSERVSKLEQLTIEQALMIKALEDRAKSRRRDWHASEGGERSGS